MYKYVAVYINTHTHSYVENLWLLEKEQTKRTRNSPTINSEES